MRGFDTGLYQFEREHLPACNLAVPRLPYAKLLLGASETALVQAASAA